MALAPGWLNLGLWQGDGGDPAEAPVAVRRLVENLAAALPRVATCSTSATGSPSRIR